MLIAIKNLLKKLLTNNFFEKRFISEKILTH